MFCDASARVSKISQCWIQSTIFDPVARTFEATRHQNEVELIFNLIGDKEILRTRVLSLMCLRGR